MATYLMKFSSGHSLMNQLTEVQKALFANHCFFEFSILEAVSRDSSSFAHGQFVLLRQPYETETLPFNIIYQDYAERDELIATYLINHLQLQTDAYGHFKTADGLGVFLTLEGQLGEQSFNVDSILTLVNLFRTYLYILLSQFQSMKSYQNIVVMSISCTVVRYYNYVDMIDASFWWALNPIGLHARNLVATYNMQPGRDSLYRLRRQHGFDAMMNWYLCIGWPRSCGVCDQVIRLLDVFAMLQCAHCLHEACYIGWFRANLFCPVCKVVYL